MSLPKYTVLSGYHQRTPAQQWFFHIWWENVMRYTNPERVIVLGSGSSVVPDGGGHWIVLSGDLGHCGQVLSVEKPYHFCGGTSSVLALLMLAYCNETDALFKEQDLLAFGPYVEKMYEEIGDHGCIFGNCRQMGTTQSLMLVRHWFIPELVRMYLGTGQEKHPQNVGESKFRRLEEEFPEKFCRYSFGVDRDRPIPYDDPIFFCQKMTNEELRELAKRGLIDITNMPDIEGAFSNHWAGPKP
jgi:hypothetical protein